MRVTSLIFVQVLMFAVFPAHAANYSIQIGAYKDPSAASIERASEIGEIFMHPGRDGLTRIRVGQYESKQEANAALQQVQAAGYADAYISDANGRQAGHHQQTTSASRPSMHSKKQRLTAAKTKVPADQHGNIVYLDGRLMLKEGVTFRALE